MRLSILLLLFAISGCEDDNPFGVVTENPSVPIPELLASEERVLDGDRVLLGEARLWRDFEPVLGQQNHRLRAIIRVSAEGTVLPADVRITRLWVIRDGLVWETSSFKKDHPNGRPHHLEKFALNGPEWDTGISVAVVFRLKGVDGGSRLLLVPSVQIVRAD